MTEQKPVHEAANDIVKRFCPHIRENVIMLKSVGDEKPRFECLNERDCRMKSRVECVGKQNEAGQ